MLDNYNFNQDMNEIEDNTNSNDTIDTKVLQ